MAGEVKLPLLRPAHGQLLPIVGSLSHCLNLRHEVDFRELYSLIYDHITAWKLYEVAKCNCDIVKDLIYQVK